MTEIQDKSLADSEGGKRVENTSPYLDSSKVIR